MCKRSTMGGIVMAKTGWENYDLETEMSKCNTAQLLMLFKREDDKYSAECGKFVQLHAHLTETGKAEMEAKCKSLDEGRQRIALRIAELLTKTK
ncbi:hypothetical protein MCCARTNEY_146 [Bacillus phage vB_BanH_McCartney]|nr:hypothetical protein MCCARTNEY_146 [Bacillus phage vB_BanH_McCartney]